MKILAIVRDILIIVVLIGVIVWFADRHITQAKEANDYLDCVHKVADSGTHDYSACVAPSSK
jgi:hypothetical protein